MKSPIIRTMSLLIMAATNLSMLSQQQIKKAFDNIIDCPQATIVESHSMERNPETGAKIGQSDIYRFTLPENKMGLVKNVLKAFREDTERAYSTGSGSAASYERDVLLAVGDDTESVNLSEPGCELIYSCFLASKDEDPEGTHRYAYAMNYKVEGNKIMGKLVITYATTLKYRQQQVAAANNVFGSKFGGQEWISNWSNFGNDTAMKEVRDLRKDAWFRKLMIYVQGMITAEDSMVTSMATKIYEHTQAMSNYGEVSAQDKEMAREVLQTLISENNYPTVPKQLLNRAIRNIK